MNCPYCNQPCQRPSYVSLGNPLGEYECIHCTGTPSFLKWDDNKFVNIPGLQSQFFEAAFFTDDMAVYFFPNEHRIFFPYFNKVIEVDFLVTPDNVMDIIQRFLNLKAFL